MIEKSIKQKNNKLSKIINKINNKKNNNHIKTEKIKNCKK
jgi:hypothetical protein